LKEKQEENGEEKESDEEEGDEDEIEESDGAADVDANNLGRASSADNAARAGTQGQKKNPIE
jgi:hypothetical protein